jgi:hypothetical protein
MIVDLIVSLFGLICCFQITDHATKLFFWEQTLCSQLKIVGGCLILSALMCKIVDAKLFWALLLCAIMVPFVYAVTIFAQRKRWWWKNESRILQILLLNVRSGMSLRVSVKELAVSEPDWFKNLLLNFSSTPTMGDSSFFRHPLVGNFLKEVSHIHQQNSRLSEKLSSLQKSAAVRFKFRQKSSTAMTQIRAQAIVITIIYLCLLSYRLFSGGLSILGPWAAVSILLYLIGTALLVFMGRTYKWKT